jgi:hypothetical protein
MKRLIFIGALFVFVGLLSGCGQTGAVDSGYENSAPAKMLAAPGKARDAAAASNDRAKAVQEAIPEY